MVDHNKQSQFHLERLKKELWTKEEMQELSKRINDSKIAKKYGLTADTNVKQTG